MKSHIGGYILKRSIGAAPLLGSERASAATAEDCDTCSSLTGRRTRRRGPRSFLSCLRRSQQRCSGAPADMVTAKSVTSVSVKNVQSNSPSLTIYCINIRCLLAHKGELEYQLGVYKSHIVLIQETWLNNSIENVQLLGYTLIKRRDRSSSENRGGVISFVRCGIQNVVHLSCSLNSERMWHYLHLDHGCIAIGNWYRSPSSGLE